MRRTTSWMLAVCTAVGVMASDFAVDDAFAASCSTLEARLASTSRARPNRSKAARYEKAVARQRSELKRTKSMARRSGCRDSGGTAACKRLTGTIKQMEARVRELDAQRRSALGGSGSTATRNAIRAQMKRKGCGARQARTARTEPNVAQGKRRRPVERKKASLTSAPSIARPGAIGGAPVAGSFRTMCVRTCDGYYFPVSNAVGPAGFRSDAARCANMCPGAETKLFVHRNSSDVDAMVDRVGRRYTSMPYAFKHQRQDYKVTKGCSCGRPVSPRPTMAKLRGSTSAPKPNATALPALPTQKTGVDAETARNAAVRFDWETAKGLIARGIDGEPTESAIRVVGPQFLPDQ